MALRLVELILPEDHTKYVQELLKDCQAEEIWYETLMEEKIITRILLPAENTEQLVDLFEKHFSIVKGFRVILIPVEASIPRQESGEEKSSDYTEIPAEEKPASNIGRISREELYHDVADSAKTTKIFFIMVILSSILAAIGLLRSNVAIIIGAMVIAPLIGPNVGLSLATTLGDINLARDSLKTTVLGTGIAFLLSVLIGSVFTVQPDIPEIASRTVIGVGDIILALAAGIAGALAFTTGMPASLIGVMVAVALLPPLVTCGMLFGSGYWREAMNSLLLVLTNIICINLAGVVTFLLQGIKPITWWEADKAKKATYRALLVWFLLLAALLLIVIFSGKL
jgi:uncharacterized hydrophobic protein (TIGR00341 family)